MIKTPLFHVRNNYNGSITKMLAKKLYDRILPVIISVINKHLECRKPYFPVCCPDFCSVVLTLLSPTSVSLKEHLVILSCLWIWFISGSSSHSGMSAITPVYCFSTITQPKIYNNCKNYGIIICIFLLFRSHFCQFSQTKSVKIAYIYIQDKKNKR